MLRGGTKRVPKRVGASTSRRVLTLQDSSQEDATGSTCARGARAHTLLRRSSLPCVCQGAVIGRRMGMRGRLEYLCTAVTEQMLLEEVSA